MAAFVDEDDGLPPAYSEGARNILRNINNKETYDRLWIEYYNMMAWQDPASISGTFLQGVEDGVKDLHTGTRAPNTTTGDKKTNKTGTKPLSKRNKDMVREEMEQRFNKLLISMRNSQQHFSL